MIALGEIGRRESPWRMAAGQLLTVGLGSAATSLLVSHGPRFLTPTVQWEIVISSGILLNMTLLIVISTMTAFGLMFYFQPKIDPTRAALIYLAEPIFAALYAYLAVGRALSPVAVVGASLILAANVLVEYLKWRSVHRAIAITSITPEAHLPGTRHDTLQAKP
jgi:drug/metabolite transporter (DMT)-like permease